MIETADYAVQFLLMAACFVYAALRSARAGDRGWLLLAFFYACYALGDLYWLLCMAFEGATPRIFYVSDLSWYVSFLFLCLLLRELQDKRRPRGTRRAYLAPAFCVLACLFFLSRGDYLGNLACMIVMGRLGYLTVRGLLGESGGGPYRRLYLVFAAFFLNEYAIWFASCFWIGDTPANPYFWFDALQSAIAVLMARAYGKAAET